MWMAGAAPRCCLHCTCPNQPAPPKDSSPLLLRCTLFDQRKSIHSILYHVIDVSALPFPKGRGEGPRCSLCHCHCLTVPFPHSSITPSHCATTRIKNA